MIGKVQVTSVPNGIQSPERGMKVKVTKLELETLQGVYINTLYTEERTLGATGELVSHVPGFDGDIWFVLHDHVHKTRYMQAYLLSELELLNKAD